MADAEKKPTLEQRVEKLEQTVKGLRRSAFKTGPRPRPQPEPKAKKSD